MNRQKWVILVVVFALIGSAAGVLVRLRTHQKLGAPGVKTSPIAESRRLQVVLPEKVLDFTSEPVEVEKIVIDTLPADTSFGQRRYKSPDGFEAQVNVVLMGSDRTSLHKPQFCLRGSGLVIRTSEPASIAMTRPYRYDLPVTKLTVAPEKEPATGPVSGVYVYWFVADHQYTAKHWQRMWWMARDILTTGVLERWAYISYFALCPPGREQEAFDRIKALIEASAPEFQLTPTAQTAAAR